MRITNIKNINEFMKALDECEGKLELVTEQGDRLNLNSKISQFVSFLKIVNDGHIHNVEIISHNKNDIERLMKLMSSG